MKIIIFPLPILFWAMGFSTFAQTNCLPLQIDTGLSLSIQQGSHNRIRLGTAINSSESPRRNQQQLDFDEFAKSGFFRKVRFLNHPDPSDCNVNNDITVGLDSMRGDIWYFDFDSMQLCRIESDAIAAFEKKGYSKVRSRITSDGIVIEIEIRRERHQVYLNFQFDGFLMLKHNQSLPFSKDVHSVFQTDQGVIHQYRNKAVKFDEIYYSGTVLLGDDEKIGLGLIKAFNWIIDMRSRNIYVKKNSRSIDSDSALTNKAVVKGGSLVISVAHQSQQFQTGDVITKIDSEPITPENACDWATRLNDSSSWKAFVIETAKP